MRKKHKYEADAKDAKAADAHAHYGAAVERYSKRSSQTAALGGLGGAHCATGGAFHAEETGEHGTKGAGNVGHCCLPVDEREQRAENDRHKDDQNGVFLAQEYHGSIVHVAGELFHQVGAHVSFENAEVCDQGKQQADNADYRKPVCN